MKGQVHHFLLLTLLLQFNTNQAQQLFHKTWSGVDISAPSLVVNNPSGGYFVGADYAPSSAPGDERFVVSSYDECDNLQWAKEVKTATSGLNIRHMISTNNGELIATGSYKEGNGDVFLLKLSTDGHVVFFKRYFGSNSEIIYSMGEFENGDLFVFGMTYTNLSQDRYRNFILRTNENGQVLWVKEYFSLPIWGRAISTSDGGVLANTSSIFFKVNHQGDLMWAKDCRIGQGYYQSYPLEVSDGYVYARYLSSNFHDTTSYLFKLGFNGETKWVGEYFKGSSINRLIATKNEFYALSNYVEAGSSASSLSVVKFNSKGDLIKQVVKTNAPDKQIRSYDIASLVNGRLLITGIESDLSHQSSRLCYAVTDSTLDLAACGKTLVHNPVGMGIINAGTMDVEPVGIDFVESNITAVVNDFGLNEVVTCEKEIALDLDLGDDLSICANQSPVIESNQHFLSYYWSTGDTTKSINVETSGEYVLTVSDGCKKTSDTIAVLIYPEIEPDYSVSPLKVTPFESVQFRSKNDSIDRLLWKYDNTTNSSSAFAHKFETNGRHQVVYEIKDEYGCVYSDTVFVSVRLVSFYMPNSFTANEDGLNDDFGPIGFGIKRYQLVVFNRWGDLIFNQENENWDGTYENQQSPTGQYMYQVELIDEFGESHTLKGRFLLYR